MASTPASRKASMLRRARSRPESRSPEVRAERAAAALGGDDDLAAVAGEHGCGRLVDPAVDEGHDAAVEHADAAGRGASGGQGLAGTLVEESQSGELPFEAVECADGSQETRAPDEGLESGALVGLQGPGDGPEQERVMQEQPQAEKDAEPVAEGAGAVRRHLGASGLHHAAVGDAGGAGGLAGAALEAEVEMPGDSVGESDAPLVDALHQGDTAAGRLGLDAELDVGGADLQAQPAVDALVEVFLEGRVGAGEAGGRRGVDVVGVGGHRRL